MDPEVGLEAVRRKISAAAINPTPIPGHLACTLVSIPAPATGVTASVSTWRMDGLVRCELYLTLLQITALKKVHLYCCPNITL